MPLKRGEAGSIRHVPKPSGEAELANVQQGWTHSGASGGERSVGSSRRAVVVQIPEIRLDPPQVVAEIEERGHPVGDRDSDWDALRLRFHVLKHCAAPRHLGRFSRIYLVVQLDEGELGVSFVGGQKDRKNVVVR